MKLRNLGPCLLGPQPPRTFSLIPTGPMLGSPSEPGVWYASIERDKACAVKQARLARAMCDEGRRPCMTFAYAAPLFCARCPWRKRVPGRSCALSVKIRLLERENDGKAVSSDCARSRA